MPDVWLETLREVNASSATLGELHPLKLDRWHRSLLELPDALYMQQGCSVLLEHVRTASTGLAAVLDVLGPDNLPAAAPEIARRHVGSFSWHVPAPFSSSGTLLFTARWDKPGSSWRLECDGDPNTTKTVPDVETALEKASSWLEELETLEDAPVAPDSGDPPTE